MFTEKERKIPNSHRFVSKRPTTLKSAKHINKRQRDFKFLFFRKTLHCRTNCQPPQRTVQEYTKNKTISKPTKTTRYLFKYDNIQFSYFVFLISNINSNHNRSLEKCMFN